MAGKTPEPAAAAKLVESSVQSPAVRLLAWYRGHARELPWRARPGETVDPYAVWLSEIMLQQTTVVTVAPYFRNFLARWPRVEDLAAASLDAVLGAWAGLGYYARARNLHACARAVCADHGGRFPDTEAGLRALPGIGPYPAAAVAAIAFGRRAAAVDGNVERVTARLFAVETPLPGAKAELRRLAEGLLPEEPAEGRLPEKPEGAFPYGDFAQAMMELGATLCVPRAPRCLACPLIQYCAAYDAGDPESLPVKGKKTPPRRIEATAALVTRGKKVLAVRRPPRGLLGGLWELPGGDLGDGEKPAAGFARALRERTGLRASGARKIGVVEHVFTHRHLHLHVYRCEDVSGRTRLDGFDAHRWLAPEALVELPQGALTRKALELLTPTISRE